MNTISSNATDTSIRPNCGESLVMNQLATIPAAMSSPRASQLINMVASYAVDGVERLRVYLRHAGKGNPS
jgi:hypothetical protein